ALIMPQSEFRIPQSDSTGGRAGVEVGETFDQHGACDAEEDRAVEPVVADAVAAVDGERDGELVESEPAVEGEADLYNVAAAERAEFDPLFLRVRAVDVYAVAVVDEEAEDRVVNLALESRAHAKRQRRARLDDSGGPSRRVEKFGAHDLGAAVAVPVCVAQRRAPLVVFALFGRVFGPRRLVLVGLLALHDDLLVVVQN